MQLGHCLRIVKGKPAFLHSWIANLTAGWLPSCVMYVQKILWQQEPRTPPCQVNIKLLQIISIELCGMELFYILNF